jgi:hypothetical protein
MKAKTLAADHDMLPEYDFSGSVRGKYYERFQQRSNVVVLDPDVSDAFPNTASVNDALRALASVARRSVARGASRPPTKRTQAASAKAKQRGSRA